MAQVMAVAAIMQAVSEKKKGEFEEQQALVESQAATIKGNQEALERRERLVQALALQSAKVGAGGITQAGSPTQVKLEDIDQFKKEDTTASAMSDIQSSQIKKRGREAGKAGRRNAGISLLSSGAQIYGAS